MKSNGFPEGEYVLNYPARVCKRFNREMFTIIPLLGDVRSLIPFVGFKNSPWDSRRWKTSKSGSANAIQQINTPPTAPFHNCRDGRCPAASPPPYLSSTDPPSPLPPPRILPAGNKSQPELLSSLHICLSRDSFNNRGCLCIAAGLEVDTGGPSTPGGVPGHRGGVPV